MGLCCSHEDIPQCHQPTQCVQSEGYYSWQPAQSQYDTSYYRQPAQSQYDTSYYRPPPFNPDSK